MNESAVCPKNEPEMGALKLYIARLDLPVFAKQAIIWLINQTKNLTQPMGLAFPLELISYRRDIIKISNFRDKLDPYMVAMRTRMRIKTNTDQEEILWVKPHNGSDFQEPKVLKVGTNVTIDEIQATHLPR